MEILLLIAHSYTSRGVGTTHSYTFVIPSRGNFHSRLITKFYAFFGEKKEKSFLLIPSRFIALVPVRIEKEDNKGRVRSLRDGEIFFMFSNVINGV